MTRVAVTGQVISWRLCQGEPASLGVWGGWQLLEKGWTRLRGLQTRLCEKAKATATSDRLGSA